MVYDSPRPRDVMRNLKKMYGSVETFDNEEGAERNKRFRVESSDNSFSQDINDVPSMPVLENPEHQTKW